MHKLNGIEISARLLKTSRIIQDMIADCKGELPQEIDIPSIGLLQQSDIDFLEQIDAMEELWDEFPDAEIDISENILKTAILMDMRYHISYICYYSDLLFWKYIEKHDILSACLENCFGHSFVILKKIIKGKSSKARLQALLRIEEFEIRDTSPYCLFEYVRLHNDLPRLSYVFSSSKFILRKSRVSEIPNYKIQDENLCKFVNNIATITNHGIRYHTYIVILDELLEQNIPQLRDAYYYTGTKFVWINRDSYSISALSNFDPESEMYIVTDVVKKFESINLD